MKVIPFPGNSMENSSRVGSGTSGRRILQGSLAALITLGIAGPANNLLDSDNLHTPSKPRLEERVIGLNRPATIDGVNYFDKISQMKFESPEDIAKLIAYTNRSIFRTPQHYRTVHEAYGRAVEASTALDAKPMQYLALWYQSSFLRRAETNIVLPTEESHTSLFGTVRSGAKLNFNFRFYNLAKSYEKLEAAEKTLREAENLPTNVGYGLNEWGSIPTLDEVHKRMVQNIDEMVALIADLPEPKYRSRVPVLVAKRIGLFGALPHSYQNQVSTSHLSPRLQGIYGGFK